MLQKTKLAYLKPLLNFIGIGLLILTISRLALFGLYYDRLSAVDNWRQIFFNGFQLDLIVISYLSFIPLLLITIVPHWATRVVNIMLSIYCGVFLFFLLFMELMTPEFVDQFDTRPNKLFIEYLIYPKEVFNMVVKARPFTLIILLAVVGLMIWGVKRISPRLFKVHKARYSTRLILFPILAFLLFWGARGSLTSRRPINASNSVFSTDQLANIAGVNSFYTVMYAAYSLKNEIDPSKLYGKMNNEEAIERVKKYMHVEDSLYTNANLPLLHKQMPDSLLEQPYNVVIFLQESLGAEYVGCLGGMPLTPNLDKLAKEGMLFTNLYCTGTRSVRGIEAVATGFLPSPSESVVKLSNSQTGFFTLASLLKSKGYDTSFIYGGMGNFDNMASFFNGNGFDKIIDETTLDKDGQKYAMKATWGYSDEDVVAKANQYFVSMGDKPFFSLMFSSSNHEPFEFPEGRIELYEEPQASVHNAMKYADYAIGHFFELAKKEKYFKNTIFIIVADHNTRTYGQNLVPINKFHIPALIIAPNVKGMTYDKLCSQIDLAPTVLNMTGLEVETPLPGRDLIRLPDSVPGRAIMQFHDINAFRVEDRVVIMQPQKEPLQFKLDSDTQMHATEVDPELAKDALGHVISASYLYKERKYKLNDKE